MERIIIIGAGPAGLTAGYELLKQSNKYEIIILEENNIVGGISKTVNYKGNRMDMGGHRFFSKDKKVNEWWENMLPLQSAPSYDDKILNRNIITNKNGKNPEAENEVMLKRNRVSRIFFDNKFYDYPISFKKETFINMGFVNTIKCGFSYLNSTVKKLPESNLENFYINRFGKKLYSMFFEYYTENLWGRHPAEIDASWGTQRVKGVSISSIIKDIFSKTLKIKNKKIETSLIEEFKYPKLGPGQLWEVTAEKIEAMGGKIIKNAKVTKIHKNHENIITSVTYIKDNKEYILETNKLISSMPIKDLICGMNNVPNKELKIAQGLPYRDYMTLGVLVSKINLKNTTKIKTINNIIPDCWVYVHDRRVKMGRFQVYNNWSPYLIKDINNTIWLGLEYFTNEGENLWNMSEESFAKLCIDEMITIGLIDKKEDVLDYHLEKVKKAYPAYFDTYNEIDTLISYINQIDNLYCVGRNGQHRYNNLDHSMITSFETVKNIINNQKDKTNIWNVNTEKEYHEKDNAQ